MTITRWRPSRDLRSCNAMYDYSPMSRMLEEFFGTDRGEGALFWGPNVDIMDSEDSYEILAELPGVRPEDVKISLNNNVLTVSGEKKQELKEDRENNVIRTERSYGRFERSFSLPTTVQSDKVRATYDHGVLRIILPKAEQAKSRQISIETPK